MDNQAYYTCPEILKARELLPGIDTHWGELTFSTSYYRVASASTNFSEFTTFFDIESMSFLNTIEINENGSGYQRVCVPYGSQVSLGNKMVTGCAWPYNCPVDGVLSTYNSDELLCDQDILMQNSPFITTPSATSLDLPEDGNRGHEFIYYLKHKLSIEGGPERELPNEEKVGIHNGFAGGIITSSDMPADGVLSANTTYHLLANPHPNLAVSSRFRYEWQYTFTPDNPGLILTDGLIYFSPLYSSYQDGSMSVGEVTGEGEIWYLVRDVPSGEVVQSVHKPIRVEPKIVIDLPAKNTNFYITTEPQMPEMVCKAHVAGLTNEVQNELQFKWTIKLSFDDYDLIKEKTVTGPIECPFNNNVWNGEFGGGYATITVTVKYNDKDITSKLMPADSVKVLGTNIEGDRMAVIESYIESLNYRNSEKAAAKGAACYETQNNPWYSQYSQFDEDGFPIREIKTTDNHGNIIEYGPGRGIMQLTFHTFKNSNTLWSWKKNVEQGVDACRGCYNKTLSDFRLQYSGYNPSDEEMVRSILTKYKDGWLPVYYKYLREFNAFVRDPYWCADCGACSDRNSEHLSTQNGNDRKNCQLTPLCYADGAYYCSH